MATDDALTNMATSRVKLKPRGGYVGNKFWLYSPWHQRYRRPARLGALAKWRREHADECAAHGLTE